MARRGRNRGRNVNGIVVVNKPLGGSSNHVLQQVKRMYGAAKAGHTGALDPLATGVLPICLGEATKFSQYLLESDKSYRTRVKLGIQTETGDREGEVVEQRAVTVTRADVEGVLERFRGEIDQVPSMYSALKHNGEPLYKLARQGITVERPARQITIHRLELLDFEGDEMVLEVECTKGTYIRTLAEDIGIALGCLGHVAELHRIKAGPYTEHQSYTLEQLEEARDGSGHAGLDQLLLPLDTSVNDWPQIKLGVNSSFYIMQGQAVQVPQAPAQGNVRIYGQEASESGEEVYRFLGVGEIDDDGRVAPKRLIQQQS
ncbi:tRNA pseudouridine(55) synthase TruB [Endozoicomonas sp. OPT23]|uniref:tRNA pseudouridine(55) synthase TruB n=1 Tax=Endozoicomonas sp. OPT23 TaxID=2072845 RepID=UPI00129B05A9|nr:tRNA pseudouridine(55) synthase TruB [Endozoicomonas sp. OPT23]MRI31807.1 tRNA pseudouridine(55) synthase TruB [Endozoicomonas sp. OPT23]